VFETLNSVSTKKKKKENYIIRPGEVAHASNPSTLKVEAEESRVQASLSNTARPSEGLGSDFLFIEHFLFHSKDLVLRRRTLS
jgi:hypothetical protein